MPNRGASLLEIEGQRWEFSYLTIDLSHLCLIDFLKAQTLFPKVYWQEKRGETKRAALGALLNYSHLPHIAPHSPGAARFFGGVGNAKDATHFWMPEFELIEERGRTFLQINFLNHAPCPRAMSRLNFQEISPKSPLFAEERISYAPSLEKWRDNVEEALKAIQAGFLEKVVLARRAILEAQSPWDPWDLLTSLQTQVRNVSFFAFAKSPHWAFIGASPEHLYLREGLHLTTEAIAGTSPQGGTPLETALLKEELLLDPKKQREFVCVKTAIESVLTPLVIQHQWEIDNSVLETGSVQHLYARLSATLKPETTDADLVGALHPTPAVCGAPKEEARNFLETREGFSRGWYAAPVGLLSSERADLVVGIRSALIEKETLSLYSGAGIVTGSDPDLEWEELEAKIAPFTRSLACPQPAS